MKEYIMFWVILPCIEGPIDLSLELVVHKYRITIAQSGL